MHPHPEGPRMSSGSLEVVRSSLSPGTLFLSGVNKCCPRAAGVEGVGRRRLAVGAESMVGAARQQRLLLRCGLALAAAALWLVAGDCPDCGAPRSDRRALKLSAIRQQILSKLSLSSRPNLTAPPPRELALEALRRVHLLPEPRDDQGKPPGPTEDDYYARTSEIIAFAEPGVTVNGHVLLDFTQRAERPKRLRVVSATLWLYVRQARQPETANRSATLYIFRVASWKNATAPLASMELLNALSVGGSTGWRRVDLRAAVQRWFSGTPSHKLTLLVDCGGCGPASIHVAQFERRQRRRPFLAIATEPVASRRRSRRYTLTCGDGVTRCCKQPLYVSFRGLGWEDWIIAPRGYYANYCVGDCASSPRTPDTFRNFHSHVIEEYRQRNPYASIAPCCAPTKLSAMSLIYFDPDQNIIKTDLPKMIVDECGCT